MKKSTISKVMSAIAKKGHKDNPRGRDYYVRIRKIGTDKRRNLSPVYPHKDI